MLALDEYRGLLCPCGCSHLAEVSQAVENEFRFEVTPARCHARTAILRAAETVEPPSEAVLFRAYLPE